MPEDNKTAAPRDIGECPDVAGASSLLLPATIDRGAGWAAMAVVTGGAATAPLLAAGIGGSPFQPHALLHGPVGGNTPARAAHTGLGMRLWGQPWLPCGSIGVKAQGAPLAFAPPAVSISPGGANSVTVGSFLQI